MPAERLPMRKVREVLRLKYACGTSDRVISPIGRDRSHGDRGYLRRAAVVGITWPIPERVRRHRAGTQAVHAGRLQAAAIEAASGRDVHAELRRRGVTLPLLWEEYRGHHPDGYGYSRFCDLYVEWRHGITATMRQTHVAGEKLFVDFAGDTVPVFDGLTGEVRAGQIFVAVLGASNYTLRKARSASEALADWIGAHVDALTFLGGVPKALVCDNLKAGVTTASRYEPGINRSYQDLAAHYGTTILPTRPRKPRDKAKVEVAVLIVEALDSGAPAPPALLLAGRIERGDPHPGRCAQCPADAQARRQPPGVLRDHRRPALLPLPAEPYEYAEWRRRACAPDYHVEVQGHFYSVPSRLIRQVVEARITEATIEVFHRGKRIAGHARSGVEAPAHHGARAHAERASALRRLDAGASPAPPPRVGPSTAPLIETIMRTKPHPEQGFRAGLGILRLAKSYGAQSASRLPAGAASASAPAPTARSPRS